MPIDRLVTVRVSETGMRDQNGEYQPGSFVDHRVWATRLDQTLEDITDTGGTRARGARDWRIRWRSDIANVTNLALVEVHDGAHVWNVENLIEDTGRNGLTRRRWLNIQGVFST